MKRKYLPMNHRKSEQGPKAIGIIGAYEGAGATHTSIMLGTYLSGERNFRTAVLEMNQKDEFRFLEREAKSPYFEANDYFNIFGTSYFKNVKMDGLNLLLQLDYDYFVMDYGSLFNKKINRHLSCGHLLIICSLIDWKSDKLYQFVRNHQNLLNTIRTEILAVCALPEDCKRAEKELNLAVHPLCCEPNPLNLTKKTKRLFHKLFV